MPLGIPFSRPALQTKNPGKVPGLIGGKPCYWLEPPEDDEPEPLPVLPPVLPLPMLPEEPLPDCPERERWLPDVLFPMVLPVLLPP